MDEPNISLSPSSPQSIELIRDFLQARHSGVLATADRAAMPHAAVIFFSADDNFRVLFATKTETQKGKNLEQNEQVALASYDEATQTSIQITGRVEVVTNSEERQQALNNLYHFSETTSRATLPPIEKLFAGDYTAFKIIPLVIKMGVFLRPDSESNEDMYETLTFTS